MSESEEAGQRVSVAEAATVLGVSKETVRRMVREGQLDGQRVAQRRGWAYRVALPTSEAPDHQVPSHAATHSRDLPTDTLTTAVASAVTQVMPPLVAQLVAQAAAIGGCELR